MQKEIYEFISQQANDPIVEWRTCSISGEEFAIFQSDKEFYDKISPVFFTKKYQIPSPTLCPQERRKRRLAWRNERQLYRTQCAITGDRMLSMYADDAGYKVVAGTYRWSDNIDNTHGGKDIDFSRSFFMQFSELYKHAYIPGLHTVENEGSEYVNQCGYSKNSYLSFNTDFSEYCYYCKSSVRAEHCVDALNIHEHCSYIYDSSDVVSSSYITGSNRIERSHNMYFCQDCTGCSFCFGSANLVNASYYRCNESLSKEEYEQKIAQIHLGSYETYQQTKHAMYVHTSKQVKQATLQHGCEDCFGNGLVNSSGARFSYDSFHVQDIKYCSDMRNAKDIMDYDIGGEENTSLCYELVSSGICHRNRFSANIRTGCTDIWYSSICFNCQHCFGCIGLKDKQYCILNKQYTKEEYYTILEKLIVKMIEEDERGEFFPISISPFPYNDTVAHEYFPLSEQYAQTYGYRWRNIYEAVNIPIGVKTISGDAIPNDIDEVDDDITKQAITCCISGKPFRITPYEISFYRKLGLPIPHKHPDVRHQERLARRQERKLYLRVCDKTGEQVVSVYPSKTSFNVYSNESYQKEIYS